MSDKDTKSDQTITDAGEVELNEEELEQVSGGLKANVIDTSYTEADKKTGPLFAKSWKVEK